MSRLAEALALRETASVSGKAFLIADATLTHGGLTHRTDRLSALFRDAGVRVGSRILIVTEDELTGAAVLIASLRNGLTAVILDGRGTHHELSTVARYVDPEVVICDAALLGAIGPGPGTAPGRLVLPVTSCAGGGELEEFPRWLICSPRGAVDGSFLDDLAAHRVDPKGVPGDTVGLILFTSGTSSEPKGVELTHDNLSAQLDTFVNIYGYGSESRILNPLPNHHTDGTLHGALIAAHAMATVTRPGAVRFHEIAGFVDRVYRERITHLMVVPAILSMILELDRDYDDAFDTPDLEVIRSSGSYLSPDLWRRFEERFGVDVSNAYGMTETVCEAIYCGPRPDTRRLGTVGKPVDCEVRVVSESGGALGPGETGELLIRGTNIMRGYLDAPGASAQSLRDGWLYTGDLASIDTEGFVSIVGRRKDAITRGAVNVHPEEINDAILRLPGAAEAATYGRSSGEWGEAVVAAVVRRAPGELDEATVLEHCRTLLAPEKIPDEVRFVDSLPRSPSGKVRVEVLREQAPAPAQEAAPGIDSSSTDERLLTLAARTFGVPRETLSLGSTSLDTDGWSSLAHVMLFLAIETEFGIRMAPADILNIESLRDARAIIGRRLESGMQP